MNHVETPAWVPVANLGSIVSEVPIWSPVSHRLYWADIYAPALQCTDVATGRTRTFPVPERLGSYGLRPDGALLALESGLFDLAFDTGAVTRRLAAPFDPGALCFNDGRADLAGRFIVGSHQNPSVLPRGRGAFFRVDADGLSPILFGVTSSNGIAFSPDGRTLYTAETRAKTIFAHTYDVATGTVTGSRVFARAPNGHYPDGAAVDSEGGYWVAMMNAGVIMRFTPAGVPTRVLKAPSRFPTMVAFGGPDLSTLFLTTSRKFLDTLPAEERAREAPLAGGVFGWRSDVEGLPEPQVAF